MCRASRLALTRGATLLGLLFVALFGSTARGDEPRLSISGYDPVAYFTDGRPVRGKAEFEHVWRKLRWRFASGEHRDLFVKHPQRYAPQYDGYCAMGAAIEAAAHKDTVDPEAWAIVDGKLYLVHSTLLAGEMARAGQGVHQAGRRGLAGRRGSSGPGHRRTALCCLPAYRCASHCATAGVCWSSAARFRATMPARSSGRRYAGADRAGRQEHRRVPQGRRRNSQRHCLYDQLRHGAADFDKYADLLPRYFGPPSPERANGPCAAVVEPRLPAASRGLRGDQASTGNRAEAFKPGARLLRSPALRSTRPSRSHRRSRRTVRTRESRRDVPSGSCVA